MAREESRLENRGNLLCVANFHSNAGYAWEFIESLYVAVADELAKVGVRTWVAYPEVLDPPRSLGGSAAEPLELPFHLNTPREVVAIIRAITDRDIRVLYLSDRPCWHPAYALFRKAGVRSIVVHDHTSGERTPPTSVKRAVKAATRRFGPGLADHVIAVSEYVRRRKVGVDLIPEGRVRTMFNSVEVPEIVDRQCLRDLYGIPEDRAVIACAARAAEYKGVQHLFRAFDLVSRRFVNPPMLVYFGDGPYMKELEAIRDGLDARDHVVLAGYRSGVAELLGGADLCVVPSTWGEAFGLAALEPAARGVAVVATRVGGIPEVVADGVTGILVPPADPERLADAMTELLSDETRRRTMGERGRERAAGIFSRARQVTQLQELFRKQFGAPLQGSSLP